MVALPSLQPLGSFVPKDGVWALRSVAAQGPWLVAVGGPAVLFDRSRTMCATIGDATAGAEGACIVGHELFVVHDTHNRVDVYTLSEEAAASGRLECLRSLGASGADGDTPVFQTPRHVAVDGDEVFVTDRRSRVQVRVRAEAVRV